MGRRKITNEERQARKAQEKRSIAEHTVFLTCNKCNKGRHITVNKPEIYTEEVKKNYACLTCRGKK